VRGVASQVVGALEQIARNPGALDGAARRGNLEGAEGAVRGAKSCGGLGGPLLQILGSFGGKSSGGHLSFSSWPPIFFLAKFSARRGGGTKKIFFELTYLPGFSCLF
jgi:hypothetical protein